MEKFPPKHNKTKDNVDNMNSLISIKEIKFVSKPSQKEMI